MPKCDLQTRGVMFDVVITNPFKNVDFFVMKKDF
jgi:hypothetical protein|tara:strand:- start:261 stop:362 length:102 start_codon:yes stop_codon:yes gene_type:complete